MHVLPVLSISLTFHTIFVNFDYSVSKMVMLVKLPMPMLKSSNSFFFYVIKNIYKREFALNLVQCFIIEHVAWAFIFGLSTSRGVITSVLFDCSPHLVLVLFGNALIIRPGKNLICIWSSAFPTYCDFFPVV